MIKSTDFLKVHTVNQCNDDAPSYLLDPECGRDPSLRWVLLFLEVVQKVSISLLKHYHFSQSTRWRGRGLTHLTLFLRQVTWAQLKQQQLKARYLSTRQSRQEALTGLATSLWEKGSNQQQISSNDQTPVSILLYRCISPEVSTVRELSIIYDKNFKRSLGALLGAIYKLEMLSIILLLIFFLTLIK